MPEFAAAGQPSAINEGFKVEVAGKDISVETDANGYFELNNIQSSSVYTLKISKKNYLTREIRDVSVQSSNVQISTQSSPLALWAGDIAINGVQDDAINMTDIMEVARSFNSAAGDGKYTADSDINKDNAVNMNDITIIARHFNAASVSYR
jgi:hypothetical protein